MATRTTPAETRPAVGQRLPKCVVRHVAQIARLRKPGACRIDPWLARLLDFGTATSTPSSMSQHERSGADQCQRQQRERPLLKCRNRRYLRGGGGVGRAALTVKVSDAVPPAPPSFERHRIGHVVLRARRGRQRRHAGVAELVRRERHAAQADRARSSRGGDRTAAATARESVRICDDATPLPLATKMPGCPPSSQQPLKAITFWSINTFVAPEGIHVTANATTTVIQGNRQRVGEGRASERRSVGIAECERKRGRWMDRPSC